MSDVEITPNIPWALMRAARSQEKWRETPGAPDMTKEGELLRALLGANDELIAVFKLYEDLKAAANVEEVTVTDHGGAGQTTENTVSAVRPCESL